MRARVKATGEILEISEDCSYVYAEHFDKSYNLEQLEILDVKEKSFPKDDPDYWTRLEHQYAGMAMHGILSNSEYLRSLMHTKYNDYRAHEVVPNVAVRLSHALVEKLKEERK